MALPDRPRNTIEALIDQPLIGSDNGERGIGPTLGEDVGRAPAAPARPGGEAKSFGRRRRELAGGAARAPLGSEIFRAGLSFSDAVLRRPGAGGGRPDRPAAKTGRPDTDDSL